MTGYVGCPQKDKTSTISSPAQESAGVAAFGKEFNADLCVRTLQSAAADRPDFYMNISDDFSVDQLKTVNAELDLTCAGARELALLLRSKADRADLVGRVGAGPAIGALN